MSHWIARYIWRRRLIGGFVNATMTRSSLALVLRQARGDRSAMPPEFVDMIWGRWGKGRHPQVLNLYRHADPDRLEEAGSDVLELGSAE